MSRTTMFVALGLVAVSVAGLLLALRPARPPAHNVIIATSGITNSQFTLHLTNESAHTLIVYPLYSFVREPEAENRSWRSLPFALPQHLAPGMELSTVIPLLPQDAQPRRVAVWCNYVRPAWKEFTCEVLIRVGLMERKATAFIALSPPLDTNLSQTSYRP